VIAGLASRLAIRDHDVTLITLDQATEDDYRVDPKVCLQPLGVITQGGGIVSRFGNMRRRIKTVRRAIDQTSADVVLSFCDRTNILTLMASRKLGIPIVVSERSDPSQQRLGRFWERLRQRNYRHAAAIVALTDSSASYLSERIGKEVIVIPSAVDRPPLVSDRNAAQQNRRIIAVGRLEHEKGFDRLLEAFSDLVIRAPEATNRWSLRMIGEGSMRRELETRIHRLNLSDRATLPGWSRSIWEEFAQATFFVLPSRYEGFPSALLEAMAVGLPSLAVDCESGPRAVIDDEINGLLVASDLTSLTTGMLRLIQDNEARERWGATGKQVVDRFDWETMVDAYEEVLNGVVR